MQAFHTAAWNHTILFPSGGSKDEPAKYFFFNKNVPSSFKALPLLSLLLHILHVFSSLKTSLEAAHIPVRAGIFLSIFLKEGL